VYTWNLPIELERKLRPHCGNAYALEQFLTNEQKVICDALIEQPDITEEVRKQSLSKILEKHSFYKVNEDYKMKKRVSEARDSYYPESPRAL
jgi:hypothetical protein